MLHNRLLLLFLLFALLPVMAQETPQGTQQSQVIQSPSEKTLIVSETKWLQLKELVTTQSLLLMDSSKISYQLLLESQSLTENSELVEESQINSQKIVSNTLLQFEEFKIPLSQVSLSLMTFNESLDQLNSKVDTTETDAIKLNEDLTKKLKTEKLKTKIIGGVSFLFGILIAALVRG